MDMYCNLYQLYHGIALHSYVGGELENGVHEVSLMNHIYMSISRRSTVHYGLSYFFMLWLNGYYDMYVVV